MTDETTPPCTPQGVTITDVNTGATYIYGTPTTAGFDTCGNPIPDICVQWRSGEYSTLWSLMDCTPQATTTTTTATVEVAAEAPTLPATGASPEVAIVAGVMLLAGVLLTKVAR